MSVPSRDNGSPEEETGRLSGLRSRLSGITSLSVGGSATDAARDVRGIVDSPTELFSQNRTEVRRVEDDLEQFYQEYEDNPFIQRPVNHTVSEVIEPGWWITADDQETVDELTTFGRNMGVFTGSTHRSFSDLVEITVRQYLVRGTFLGEKVYTKDHSIEGAGRLPIAVQPINSETIEAYTKNNQSVLIPPEFDTDGSVKDTEQGEAAAWVQYDATIGGYTDREERYFTREQMLHWPRNPDVGDIFGTSVVKPVYRRARAVRQKLLDNDDAIAKKAWPMVLFRLGEPERPYTDDQQDEFMKAYSDEEFGPGQYQGVPGDVEVKEFAGETADISEHVATDVDFILAGMPGPKFTLGSFNEDIGKSVSESYERQFKKTVRSLRRGVERVYMSYFREVAEMWGLDNPDSVELHIGRPEGQVAPEDVNGSTIRYTSDVSPEDETEDKDAQERRESVDGPEDAGASTPQEMPQESSGTAGGASSAPTQGGPSVSPDVESASLKRTGNEVAELLASSDLDTGTEETDIAELADSRLVSTTDAERDLTETVTTVLQDARRSVLSELEANRNSADDVNPNRLPRRVRQVVRDRRRALDFEATTRRDFTGIVQDTLSTLGQESHSPQLERSFGPRHTELLDTHADSLRRDLDALATELGHSLATQVSQARGASSSLEDALERAESTFDDATLRNRAQLFARMHASSLVNETKLLEYQNAEAVTGVTITNPCNDATHSLCRELAGCDGESATAVFEDGDIGPQLQSDVNTEPSRGFDPLGIPPFHFSCRSELVPITDD